MTSSGKHGRGWVGWQGVQVDLQQPQSGLRCHHGAEGHRYQGRVGGHLRPGIRDTPRTFDDSGAFTGGAGVRRTLASWAGLVAGMENGKPPSLHQMEPPRGVLGTKPAA